MDLIAGYDIDDDLSLHETEEIGLREVKQVYLVTYSQADTIKFPTTESFADTVVSSFRAPSAGVLHWCSKEPQIIWCSLSSVLKTKQKSPMATSKELPQRTVQYIGSFLQHTCQLLYCLAIRN